MSRRSRMIRLRDAGSSSFKKLDDPASRCRWSGFATRIIRIAKRDHPGSGSWMIRFKKPDDPASRCRMIRLLEADNPHREAGSSGFMKQDNPAEAKDLFGKFHKLAITYSETANVSNISDDTCDHKHTLNKSSFILQPSLVPSCLGLSW